MSFHKMAVQTTCMRCRKKGISAELNRISGLVDIALRAYRDKKLTDRVKVARMRLIKNDAVAALFKLTR